MSTVAQNERLAAITAAGTSIWLDQVRRSTTEGGELARMVEEDSLRGVTSNPAIFEKSILGSSDYDEQVHELAEEGLDADALYQRIAVRDIQEACDVLRPVYDESNGEDGYVSLEVSPSLARDTEQGTITEARELWKLVDRPNLMVKIPGTPEGLEAIETALYEGININITLLFAVGHYEQVMEKFISAMERRHAEGKSLDVHSVASFFVSRVDTEIDKRLEKLGREDLQGKAGVANAQAAYQAFKNIFEGERFAKLREAGCPVQRPLWASTGVKNPKYPDTMYVDELIAPHTVNTMPLATLQAAAQKSEVRGATADQDPSAILKELADAGIDLEDVTTQLLDEGIETFVKSFTGLIDGIDAKREAIVTKRPKTIDATLPEELELAVRDRVQRAGAEEVVRRIWRKDGTLWAPEGTDEVENRLGWLTITHRMRDGLAELMNWAEEMNTEFDRFVLLGMGGSSLAPEVFKRSYGAENLIVLDSTDPSMVSSVQGPFDKTCFIVATKSGGTVETLSQYRHFSAQVGNDPKHFVAITDPGSSLLEGNEFRKVFTNDPDIGGRYSALSYFGLVPAALMGIDVSAVLETAQLAVFNCEQSDPDANSGLWMGAVLGELASRGRDKLTFIVDEPLGSFGLWAEQLVAESTGKQGRGILPIADEPLVDPDSYNDDRVFLYLRHEEEPAFDDDLKALAEAGHPTLTVQFSGPEDLGRIFFFSEFATAVAGWALEINPFDQPNVQEAKDNTSRVLREQPEPPAEGELDLEGAGYLAIMAYLPYDAEVEAAIEKLRARVIEKYGIATTFGYGPRFLHSTGQFHKGGPKGGAFLQLTHGDDRDVPIPGQPFSFRQLIRAQADGDLATLRDHGLKAARVTITLEEPTLAIDGLEV
jgi:transaldolase/glucose-6-phosphate isomerase